MTADEFEQRKAELKTAIQEACEELLRPKTPSETLDAARENYERLIGQPCIAQYGPDGTIQIQTPVLHRLHDDEETTNP